MAGPTKPSLYLDWTNGSSPYVTQPPSSLQTSGWVPGEQPPPDYMNWLFWLTDSWIQWLDYEVENIINEASGISANNIVLTTTGNITNLSNQLTNLASITGIVEGQLIVGTGIPANTYVKSIVSTTVTMSQNATANLTANAVNFEHTYATGANVQVQLDALDAIISAIANVQYPITATTTVLSTTGTTTNGSPTITSLASTSNLLVGMAVSGTGIPSGSYILSISGSSVTMNQNANAGNTGVALTFGHNFATGSNVQSQLDELDAAVQARISLGTKGIVSVVANYSITSANAGQLLEVNTFAGAISLQLPNPSTMANEFVTIKDVGGYLPGFNLTLLQFSSEEIEGVAESYIMRTAFFFATLFCDGTNWWLIA